MLDERVGVGVAPVEAAAIGLGVRGEAPERSRRGKGLGRGRARLAAQRGRELVGGGVALGRIDRERAREHAAQPRVGDRVERRHERRDAVATPAGEQRDEHERGRKQIRARVDAAVAELLRRHVRGRAAGGLGRLIGGAQAREPEVDEHHAVDAVARRDDRVRRLDVGVHEPGGVRGGEAREQLAHERDRAAGLERALRDERLQIAPGEQLHRVEQPAVAGRVGLEDAHDVRVIDAPDALDLLHEQPAILGGGRDAGAQDLDRDVALDRQLARAIDRAERPAGDELVEAKAAGEHRAGQVVVVRRVRRVRRGRRAALGLRARRGRRADRRRRPRAREVLREAARGRGAGARVEGIAGEPGAERFDERHAVAIADGLDRDGARRELGRERGEPAPGIGGVERGVVVRGQHDERFLAARGGELVAQPRQRERGVLRIDAVIGAGDQRGLAVDVGDRADRDDDRDDARARARAAARAA